MIESVLVLLIYLLIIAAVFWLAVWVLGVMGIAVPARVIQIVGAIVVLLLILAFLQGGLPHLKLT